MPKTKSDCMIEVYEAESSAGLRSKEVYAKRWAEFMSWSKLKRPGSLREEHFVLYFSFLRRDRGMAASSIWSIYSMLNHHMAILTSQKLQQWSRLTNMIKAWGKNESPKQASVFSVSEVEQFLQDDHDTQNDRYWRVRKATVAISFMGGLRAAECVGLVLTDVVETDNVGFLMHSWHKKQSASKARHIFTVPGGTVYSRRVSGYLSDRRSIGGTNHNKLFLTCTSTAIKNSPMGINTFYRITQEAAHLIGFPNPSSWTLSKPTITPTPCLSCITNTPSPSPYTHITNRYPI